MRGWLTVLNSAAKIERVQPPKRELVRLAAVLSMLGTSTDNKEAYWSVKVLFFNKYRIAHWASALDLFSAEAQVTKVVQCVDAFTELSPLDLTRCRFNLVDVIKVMLDARSPQALIKSCVRDGIDHLGGIFHPNTLKAAEKRVRGALGKLADEDATKAIRNRVRTLQT